MLIKFKKLPLNALNLIYCKFHIAQIIIIEDIDNIIKGTLEVFISVVVVVVVVAVAVAVAVALAVVVAAAAAAAADPTPTNGRGPIFYSPNP